MGTLVTTDAVNGTTADASLVNNNNTAIKAVVNGGIDSTNLSASYRPPGYQFAYINNSLTNTVSTSTTSVMLAFPAATYDGGTVWMEFTANHLTNSGGNPTRFWFGEGGSVVSNAFIFDVPNTTLSESVAFQFRYTPTAAAHTFQVLWSRDTSGTSTLDGANVTTITARITKE